MKKIQGEYIYSNAKTSLDYDQTYFFNCVNILKYIDRALNIAK